MARYAGIAVLFVLSIVLQTTLFDFWKFAGVKPDLVLLLVIYFAFTNGPLKGALLGLLFGALVDLQVGYNLGMYALAFVVAGFIAGWFETRMYKENLLIALLVTFVTTVISQEIIWFTGSVVGFNWDFKENLRWILFLAIYNTCLVPFTYPWFHASITRGLLRYRPKHEK
ncbi:MAG TPA: rod shape-determining protein MreD [Verrucomicrobiae bacterium]|nr:rod shape-determining protein MreD [Verrucomicrobiae bacterium]